MRKRKYYVVVCSRKQFCFFVGYPLVSFASTTIGAMTIATTMKLVLFISADRTLAAVMMHADIAGVAVGQLFEDVAAVLITHRSACSPKHHLLEFLGYLSHF